MDAKPCKISCSDIVKHLHTGKRCRFSHFRIRRTFDSKISHTWTVYRTVEYFESHFHSQTTLMKSHGLYVDDCNLRSHTFKIFKNLELFNRPYKMEIVRNRRLIQYDAF